eukprot:11902963-Karenia_brevis.AAC.1
MARAQRSWLMHLEYLLISAKLSSSFSGQSGNSQGPASVVFAMLQRIDEAIRFRWATAFRATLAENQVDGFTFGE